MFPLDPPIAPQIVEIDNYLLTTYRLPTLVFRFFPDFSNYLENGLYTDYFKEINGSYLRAYRLEKVIRT